MNKHSVFRDYRDLILCYLVAVPPGSFVMRGSVLEAALLLHDEAHVLVSLSSCDLLINTELGFASKIL